MPTGLGTVHLRKVAKSEQESFFDAALQMGCEFLDTSPFYSGALIERLIGEARSVTRNFKVITKFGLPYEDLATLKGKIAHRYWSRPSTDNQWGHGFKPSNLRKELEKSLRRMNLDSCHGYLMHSIDDSTNIDDYVSQLISFKDAGLVQKIGFSIDSEISADFSWADYAEIPCQLSNWAKGLDFNGTFIVNSFMRDGLEKVLDHLTDIDTNLKNSIFLLGTSNLTHLEEFAIKVRGLKTY